MTIYVAVVLTVIAFALLLIAGQMADVAAAFRKWFEMLDRTDGS